MIKVAQCTAFSSDEPCTREARHFGIRTCQNGHVKDVAHCDYHETRGRGGRLMCRPCRTTGVRTLASVEYEESESEEEPT